MPAALASVSGTLAAAAAGKAAFAAEDERYILLGPGGCTGSIARCELRRIILVARLAQRCHELRGPQGGKAADSELLLLRQAGEGDKEAIQKFGGLAPSPDEARDAAAAVRADLALLAQEERGDVDLAAAAVEAAAERSPFERLDRDGDGFLCREDFAVGFGAEAAGLSEAVAAEAAAEQSPFEGMDRDGDGMLTREEFALGFGPEAAGLPQEGHGPLHELPFAVAEALKWVAWHEAWLAALARAGSGSRPLLVEDAARSGLPSKECLRAPIRQRLAEKARAAWAEACGAQPALGSCQAEALAAAAGAAARHAAARFVHPKRLEDARTEWRAFAQALHVVEAEGALGEDLQAEAKWLFWNAAWHATNLVSQHQNDGETDGEPEEEEEEEQEDGLRSDNEIFEDEDYPGIDLDPLKNLSHFLLHAVRLHRSDALGATGEPWRGLCLPSGAKEPSVHQAAAAGFSAVRLAVATPRAAGEDALRPLQPLLRACAQAGILAVLDFMSWSLRGHNGHEALCRCLGSVAAAAASSGEPQICGVALPRVTSPQGAAPLVEALRAGGLRPETCAAIVQLEDSPFDEDGNYAGFLRKALCQGEQGLLLADGHVVLEVYRRPPEVAGPGELLDAAAASLVEAELPLFCFRWSLAVPASLTRECQGLGERWREELAARWEAGSGRTTHGWFATLDDATVRGAGRTIHNGSLQMCLARRWSWPDPLADRVMWPHGRPHKASFVYLHGFTCDGASYLPCYNFFRKELSIPFFPRGSEDEEEVEDEFLEYVPFPGLKVILPSAPVRPISCYGGQKHRSWYDYKTDHEGNQEDELSLETLEEVVYRMQRLLDAEASLLGGPERVLLGGASQGAAVALHAALGYAGRLGGVVATQGHLLSSTLVPPDWASRGTPVRVFNGLADSTMPWTKWVSGTYDRLRESGGDVEFVTDDGVDHGDDDAEGRWVRAFLQEMWRRWGLEP